MTRTNGDQTLTAWLKALEARVMRLERRASDSISKRDLEIVFGPIKASDVYGPDWVRFGATLYSVEARLGTVGSTSTTITVKRNGSAITGGTLTLTASTSSGQLNVTPVAFKNTDLITLDVLMGTGADDLVTQLYFRGA